MTYICRIYVILILYLRCIYTPVMFYLPDLYHHLCHLYALVLQDAYFVCHYDYLFDHLSVGNTRFIVDNKLSLFLASQIACILLSRRNIILASYLKIWDSRC